MLRKPILENIGGYCQLIAAEPVERFNPSSEVYRRPSKMKKSIRVLVGMIDLHPRSYIEVLQPVASQRLSLLPQKEVGCRMQKWTQHGPKCDAIQAREHSLDTIDHLCNFLLVECLPVDCMGN